MADRKVGFFFFLYYMDTDQSEIIVTHVIQKDLKFQQGLECTVSVLSPTVLMVA